MKRKKGVVLGIACQVGVNGVRCKLDGQWIVGWPRQMLVCAKHQKVLARLRAKAEKKSAAKPKPVPASRGGRRTPAKEVAASMARQARAALALKKSRGISCR